MLSGFLSSGTLCLIHQLKLFWPHVVSMASVRKGAPYISKKLVFWWSFPQKITGGIGYFGQTIRIRKIFEEIGI